MDVIVRWDDGSENCVYTKELCVLQKGTKIRRGVRVKMLYENKWYYGIVTVTEEEEKCNERLSDKTEESKKNGKKGRVSPTSSSDEQPLVNLKSITKPLDVIAKLPGKCANSKATLRKGRVSPSSSSDEQPIANYLTSETKMLSATKQLPMNVCENEDISGSSTSVVSDDASILPFSDLDDPDYVQTCEVDSCKKEVFSSCFRCSILLCWEHFEEEVLTCEEHGKSRLLTTYIRRHPEEFAVEGGSMEHTRTKEKKVDKRKLAKSLRNKGKQYINPVTKKQVAARKIGPRCDQETCKKFGRNCFKFTEADRILLFEDFYKLGSLQLQREFISRYVQQTIPKQRTTQKEKSRREKTNYYKLPLNRVPEKVCQRMFLSTLGVSEKMVRTVLKKVKETGVIEKDHRGGRRVPDINRDSILRNSVEQHILRFPKVESHYCRQSSSRQYLHEDLSLPKMYDMYIKAQQSSENFKLASFALYRKVFKSMNLSFHRPKKDQCGICRTYRGSTEENKLPLESKYKLHIEEKNKIREIKEVCKNEGKVDASVFCGCFDLQQVIYLPICNDSAIYYKSRLSVFNLTIYNIVTRKCCCFVWNETDSRRGSSEISSCLYKMLQLYDEAKVKKVNLFADGCSGQNRNSVVASTLLYIVHNFREIEEISLRFFAPYHGQNEGDSAHSAIGYALKTCGEVFLPSQLYPVFRLARRRQPYEVVPMTFSEFQNFKWLSEKLRVLTIREDDSGEKIKWTEMVEFKVSKGDSSKILFKTSHLQSSYRSLSLKRNVLQFLNAPIPQLNDHPIELPERKYTDLMALCSGVKPPINLPEYVHFYRSLPH